jgi:hypothetical protein
VCVEVLNIYEQGRRKGVKERQYGELTCTTTCLSKDEKVILSITRYPRPWCCIPCEYKSNEPKHVSIRVLMRKWLPNYCRESEGLTSTGVVVMTIQTSSGNFVKLKNIFVKA